MPSQPSQSFTYSERDLRELIRRDLEPLGLEVESVHFTKGGPYPNPSDPGTGVSAHVTTKPIRLVQSGGG